jgi:MoxR-like ATPase
MGFDDYSADASKLEETKLPDPSLKGDHPRDYKADDALVYAVNTALVLNRPLLLTGEPGTGKTQLAYSLAWQLANKGKRNVTSANVIKFETKSTTVARDVFYLFDKIAHFHAPDGKKAPVHHITYQGLGAALLRAMSGEQVAALYPPGHTHGKPARSVVLIDEVDKAPRDFPNDLLNEIDQMYFRIPELDNAEVGGAAIDDAMKPIVIITSNSDKVLPPPFLRRCVYCEIPPPTEPRLREILESRLRVPQNAGLVKSAAAFLVTLREQTAGTYKISAPELAQWVRAMIAAGADPALPLARNSVQARQTFSAMVKFRDSDKKCLALLEEFMRAEPRA